MCAPSTGFMRGFNSGEGSDRVPFELLLPRANRLFPPGAFKAMIALPDCKVVKYGSVENPKAPSQDIYSQPLVAVLAIGRLELVQLSIALTRVSAFRSLAIKIRPRAIIQRRVQIDPDLGVGIALILRRFRRICQAHADEHLVEQRQLGRGIWLLALHCA